MSRGVLRLLAAFAIVAGSAGLTVATPEIASASSPITGAGSTWVQPALDQWRADVAKFGLQVNYQGVGSTSGRNFFVINQVDFAASEIPFLPDELNKLRAEHKTFQYIPDVAGGTALMYNLVINGRRVTSLNLDAPTIAGIFTGQITNWNDPKIAAQNRQLQLPDERIQPVIRSDGSGTSAKLADYLLHEAGSIWTPFARQNHLPSNLPVSFWPSFPGSVAQNGSDGVANYVANDHIGQGAIGYVETSYAILRQFPVASVKNGGGHYVQPTSQNLTVALSHATLNKDLTQNLTGVYNAKESNAYSLASYSYLITQTKGMDPSKGETLGRFILYIACHGQTEAAPLGYAPMPVNLVQAVFQAVGNIPGAPPPPNMNTCQHGSAPPVAIDGHGGGGGGGTTSGGTTSGASTTSSAAGTTGTGSGSASTSAGTTSTAASAAGLYPGYGDPNATLGINVTPLTAAERAASFNEASKQASYARSPSAVSLGLGGFALLALVFTPLFLQRRRRTVEEDGS